ncbi:MAG TPA: Co2+/Mg2+ efflux protein ApaG [Alphaproteobacteria bacterium]|nr:Co2+/Mg2+ efflux protein ApaG [Alphaproteobacteria bacterium]HAJ47809.1 Co2+/Mg2+ efflux protein ApaG [Alphaproteobacteria bacterium]
MKIDPRTGQSTPAERRNPYVLETHSIRVTVSPDYLDDESSPGDNRFVWAYMIRIENLGPKAVQLRSRYWRITDATGRVMEVRGAGVVGQQPTLKPGESFEYTSSTPLSTPSGFMSGIYQMLGEGGEIFQVGIPLFSLDSPHQPRRLH